MLRVESFLKVAILLFFVAILMFFAGCSTVERYKNETVDELRKANDLALETAEQAYCDGAVEGALVRRYGDAPDIQKARNELCRLIRAKHYGR